MTLREQLMLKRALRRLRTWAPPISMGVIIGAGAFLVAERLEPARAAPPQAWIASTQRAANAPREARSTRMSQPSRAYSDCDAARAAGAAPLRVGDPGYGRHLDADRDGVACEPHLR